GAVPAGPPESNGACIASHYATTDVKSSIFADSVTGSNCDGVTDEGYNLSDDGTCGFSGTSENSVTNLKLYPLALNGGPTETMALGYGSKAINFYSGSKLRRLQRRSGDHRSARLWPAQPRQPRLLRRRCV